MVTREEALVTNDESDMKNLMERVQALNIDNQEIEKPDVEASDSLRKVASWIADAKRILILSGAGVSCAAGIPDFRTPGTGLYDNLEKYDLPYPEVRNSPKMKCVQSHNSPPAHTFNSYRLCLT